jgi:hypothetical protein
MHSYRVQVTFMSTCWLTLSAVTVPPHTPAMETRHLMYLSFHTCNILCYNSDVYRFTTVQWLSITKGCLLRRVTVMMEPILRVVTTVGSIMALTLLNGQPLMREHRRGTAVFLYLGLAVEEDDGHDGTHTDSDQHHSDVPQLGLLVEESEGHDGTQTEGDQHYKDVLSAEAGAHTEGDQHHSGVPSPGAVC